ncbi:MAG: hypothetical protein ACRD2J_15085 [Thermoanaerobaculia bacterium]
MKPGSLTLVALALLAASITPAWAVEVSTDRFRSQVALEADGSLLIDNMIGPVTVIGTPHARLRWEAVKTVRGLSATYVQEGREFTRLELFGGPRDRALRTVIAYPLRNGRWESSVSYTVEVPAGIDLTIVTMSSEIVRVSGVTGSVNIKNVNGTIEVVRIDAPVNVETVNGRVRALLPERPSHDMRFASLTGRVEVEAPPRAAFTWIAETMRGGAYASVDVSAALNRQNELRRYVSQINGGGSPTIVTRSILGDVYFLRPGATILQAQANPLPETRPASPRRPQPLRADMQLAFRRVASTVLMQVPTAHLFATQRDRVTDDFRFEAPIGSIFVGQIDGNAAVSTRAGEVVLGRVGGRVEIRSLGGSIHLGNVRGPLDAHTSVGDIIVRSVENGGTAATDAGMVRIATANGALTLRSGGGDVIVHRTGGPIDARTTSGDIWIGIAPTVTSQTVHAETDGGNVALHIPDGFAADIDAVVTTRGDGAGAIQSDFPGLTIVRETSGNGTRIRATGKLNGGGRAVVLRATDGTIEIRRSVDVVTSR